MCCTLWCLLLTHQWEIIGQYDYYGFNRNSTVVILRSSEAVKWVLELQWQVDIEVWCGCAWRGGVRLPCSRIGRKCACGLSGVHYRWYGDRCTQCCFFFLPLCSWWSRLCRHTCYCQWQCTCSRYGIVTIDPIECDCDWWRWYGALTASKYGCVSSCLPLIDEIKRESESRGTGSIVFVSQWNINQSMVSYCTFVVISKINDYRLNTFLYCLECCMVIAHMVRCSGNDIPSSCRGGCIQLSCIFSQPYLVLICSCGKWWRAHVDFIVFITGTFKVDSV